MKINKRKIRVAVRNPQYQLIAITFAIATIGVWALTKAIDLTADMACIALKGCY